MHWLSRQQLRGRKAALWQLYADLFLLSCSSRPRGVSSLRARLSSLQARASSGPARHSPGAVVRHTLHQEAMRDQRGVQGKGKQAAGKGKQPAGKGKDGPSKAAFRKQQRDNAHAAAERMIKEGAKKWASTKKAISALHEVSALRQAACALAQQASMAGHDVQLTGLHHKLRHHSTKSTKEGHQEVGLRQEGHVCPARGNTCCVCNAGM